MSDEPRSEVRLATQDERRRPIDALRSLFDSRHPVTTGSGSTMVIVGVPSGLGLCRSRPTARIRVLNRAHL
jgi:hypothetical protein